MIMRCNAANEQENFWNALAIGLFLSFCSIFDLPARAAEGARLAPEDCRRVTAHVADPSVAFQPGVGAGGRRVAPADLAPPPRTVPDRPVIALGVDLQSRYGLAPDIKADLPLGIITLEGGRLLFNGRPLAPEDQAALAAACAAARR
jgi:hypothetical protein